MDEWIFDVALFAKIERTFRSFFFPDQQQQQRNAPNGNSTTNNSLSTWIRDFSMPLAVNCSAAHGQRFWLEKLDGLARDRCRKAALELLNEIEMMVGPSSASSINAAGSNDKDEDDIEMVYLLGATSSFFRKFQAGTKFLAAACFHVEQAAVEAARGRYIHNAEPGQRVNVTEKAQRKAVDAAGFEHIFARAFVAEFVHRVWSRYEGESSSDSASATAVAAETPSSSSRPFLDRVAATIVAQMLVGSNRDDDAAVSRSAAATCGKVFSMISGFRTEHLLPALRKRAVKMACNIADHNSNNKDGGSQHNQEQQGDCFLRLRAVFGVMQQVRSAAARLLPATCGALEFKLHVVAAAGHSNAPLKFARRDYSFSADASTTTTTEEDRLVQMVRLQALGGEGRMQIAIQETITPHVAEAAAANATSGSSGNGEQQQLVSGVATLPYALFSVAGVQETAKALSAQCEEDLLRFLERDLSCKASSTSENETSNSNVSNAAALLRRGDFVALGAQLAARCARWQRFVTCDECIEESPFAPLPCCADMRCCAGHTVVASALFGAFHSALTHPKFVALTTACLLQLFHSKMTATTTASTTAPSINSELTRLLQIITSLSTGDVSSSSAPSFPPPSAAHAAASSSTGDTSNAAASPTEIEPADTALAHAILFVGQHQHPQSGGGGAAFSTLDWTWSFHQLAFQRLFAAFLSNRRTAGAFSSPAAQQQHRRQQEELLRREELAAHILQQIAPTDAHPYLRRYRGLIRAALSTKLNGGGGGNGSGNGGGAAASVRLGLSVSDSQRQQVVPLFVPLHFAAFLAPEMMPLLLSTSGGASGAQKQQQQQFERAMSSGLVWPSLSSSSHQDQFRQHVEQRIAAVMPSTRLHWLPHDGEFRATVASSSRTAVWRVRGSPLQMCVLLFIGACHEHASYLVSRDSVDETLYEYVWGEPRSASSASEASRNSIDLRCALAALSAANLIVGWEANGSGRSIGVGAESDKNSSLKQQHAASSSGAAATADDGEKEAVKRAAASSPPIRLNDAFLDDERRQAALDFAVDVRPHSVFSRDRSDTLAAISAAAVRDALGSKAAAAWWGPITAEQKREAAARRRAEQQQSGAAAAAAAANVDGTDSDRSSHGGTPRGASSGNAAAAAAAASLTRGAKRLSSVAAKALAMQVLKRQGRLSLDEWLRRCRELLSQQQQQRATAAGGAVGAAAVVHLGELSSRQFRDAVVPELVQAEFVELEENGTVAVYLP